METVDIYSRGSYPADALSNFAAYDFTLDGVSCASIEGFLQALKTRSPARQREICRLHGVEAKNAGAHRRMWRLRRRVWWLGKAYGLYSDELQQLIDRAYDALYAQSPAFREALAALGTRRVVHTIGKHDMRRTILTEYHFVRRIEALRARLPRA